VAFICHKIGPALLAGCTVVLKSAPEAPGEGYVFAEAAEQIGLPPGVLNVLTADREVSELLVSDPGVDKITFTGSTAAGRRIANDVERARAVARELRSGTVGHNAFRTDFGMAFGGFKQSGIGREGGKEGLLPFLETKGGDPRRQAGRLPGMIGVGRH
jgi:acyl-CoA reductase-like NAD-dependent aldehyde dehydrogenase